MKRLFSLDLATTLALLLAPAGYGQSQQQQPAQAPAKPPRVLGQAQTQPEFDAFTAIENAATPDEKAKLAEQFLANFPDSGLTPFVHQVAALSYQQTNSYEKFIDHAEKTLAELPQNPLILTSLAVAYAQRGRSTDAMDRAEKGLKAVDALQKPLDAPQAQWDAQIDQLRADAHYALGTAYLEQFVATSEGKTGDLSGDPSLKLALDYLERSVTQDPGYDVAYYRLGFAYVKKNDADSAIKNYARAVALERFVSAMARESLYKVYEFMNPKKGEENDQQYNQRISDELNKIIAAEREHVQNKISEKQARLQQP